jgi:hypothetical protein
MRRFCRAGCNPGQKKIAGCGCKDARDGVWTEDVTDLLDRFSRNLSATSVAAAAEMAVGVGAGLLVADQLGKSARQRLGIVVLLAGLAATVPLLIGAGVRVNRELGEGRRTRRRLETIRHDSGFAEDGDFY